MKNGFLNKQIPTLLGMAIIIGGLSITTLLTNRQTFFQTGAQENKQPQEVRITNVTDNTFTVSYKTGSNISGYINFGTNNSLGQTAFDEKDVSQKLQNHTIHSITVSGLTPITKYYFSIISGGETYLNNEQNFSIITSAKINSESNQNLFSGKIILPDATPADETIVYLTLDNSQVLSSLTTNGGIYTFNLNHLLTYDLSRLSDLTKNSTIQMLITNKSLSSTIKIYYWQLKNIPIITLSNDYDFRLQEVNKSSSSAALTSFPILQSTTSSKTKNLQILSPQSKQTISNQKPTIKGLGAPNQNINITIHSNQIVQASVTTDINGNWSYQPTISLEPGQHTITVTTKDSKGVLKTVTQSFVVNADTKNPSPTITKPDPSPTTIKKLAINVSSSNKPSLSTTENASIITAGIVGLLITTVGGLIFLLSRKEF